MHGTKHYQFIGFGAMDNTRPCKFIRFGAMDVTKPYKFRCFALRLFGRVWRPMGPVQTPNINDCRLRPKPWLQMARTLVSMAVACNPHLPHPRDPVSGTATWVVAK